MHFNVYLQTIDDDEGYVFVELNFAWRERERGSVVLLQKWKTA